MEIMLLSASSLPCHKCRELACSLIKSVDAFEILASGNSAIPNQVLIQTIREIVARTVTKEDKDGEPEGKDADLDQTTNSNQNTNTKMHVNAINSCSLNVAVDTPMEMQDKKLSIPTPAFDDHLLDYGEMEKRDDRNMKIRPSDTTIVKCRGRGRGRGRRGRKRQRIGMPQKSVSRRKRYTSQPSLESGGGEEEEENTSDTSNSNSNYRTLATDRDYGRASQYMKKVEMETQDGFFYHLFECITCTRQFSQSQNLRRHIVSLHFNKKVIRDMDGNRMTKVRRHYKPDSLSSQKSTDSSSSSCLVPTNPIPEEKRASKGKSIQGFQIKLENQHQHQYESQSHNQYQHQHYNTQILSKYGLPLDFTVRNPCKNFDLEKTLNARVSLTSISIPPNLTTSKSNESSAMAGNDKNPFQEELSDIPDISADDEAESSPSFAIITMDTDTEYTDTSRYQSITIPSQESPPKLDYSPGFNYDKIDLIEMDVDTIMAIDF